MAEITGGELKYVATIDTEGFRKGLTDAEGKLRGFSEVAEKAGKSIEDAFGGATTENVRIQREVIKELETQYKELQKSIDSIAPGKAQNELRQQAIDIKGEIDAEKKALDELVVAVKENQVVHERLSQKLLATRNEMAKLAYEGKQDTEQYRNLSKEATEYQKALTEVNGAMKAMKGSPSIDAFVGTLGLASGAMATFQGLTAMAVGDNENLMQIMIKLQATMSVAVGIQQLQNSLQRESSLIQAVHTVQIMAKAKAEALATKGTVAATIAQKAFNLVAKANPYVLLATAILSVVGAIALYTSSASKAARESKKMADLNKAIADSVAEPMVQYRRLQLQWNDLADDLKKKQKFIEDNKEVFEGLGVEVKNVNDAENVLRTNSKAFVETMMLRARAAAHAQSAVKNYQEALELEREYSRKYILKDRTTTERMRDLAQGGVGGMTYRAQMRDDAREIQRRKEDFEKDLQEEKRLLKESANILTAAGIKEFAEMDKKVAKSRKAKKPEEILPVGSVAELRKRLSEIDELLSKSTDQWQINALKDKRIKVAEELAEAEKRIAVRSFQEQIEYVRQQIELRDKMLQQGYSKEQTDAFFPEVKDLSYEQYLTKTEAALNNLIQTGNGSKQTAENLTAIGNALDDFKARDTFIDSITKEIEGLKSSLSGDDFIDKLEGLKRLNPNLTESQFQERNNIIDRYINEEIESQKKAYQEFLNDHKSYEAERTEITRIGINMRQKILEDDNLSADEKARLQNESRKKEFAAISKSAYEQFTNSDVWTTLYDNIDSLTVYQIDNLLQELEKNAPQLQKMMMPADYNKIIQQLRQVRNEIENENPFMALGHGMREFFEAFKDGSDEMVEGTVTNFEKVAKGASGLMKGVNASLDILEPLRGGFSDVANDAIDALRVVATTSIQMVQTVSKSVKSIRQGLNKSTWSNWILALIQIIYLVIKAIISLLTWFTKIHDKKRERSIQSWKKEVEKLKDEYEALEIAISRIAGEGHLTRQRELVQNLQQQYQIIQKMKRAEQEKKKADQGKVDDYISQMIEINNQVQQIADDFKASITTTDFRDMSQKLADALTEAWQAGEDGVEAYGKTVEQIMADAVKNALRIKILEPVTQQIVDELYNSMGFGGDNSGLQSQISSVEAAIADINNQMQGANFFQQALLQHQKEQLLQQLAVLQQQLANAQMAGSFDGLTDEEREELMNMGNAAMQQYMAALQQYEDLFGSAAGNAQSLKGDIRGITEKTAGALEGQINAMRIQQVNGLQVAKDSLLNLIQIEINTRHLLYIRKNIEEMNSKMKHKLAGVP